MANEGDSLLGYIAALEDVNGQLVATLEHCISLLAGFRDQTPDPEAWVEKMGMLALTLLTAEGVLEKKTMHWADISV